MAFHFLLLSLLLYLSNTVIAAADGEFPPHLSFEQYRSLQSFAGDENNKLISELTSNGWDDFLLRTWYTNLQLTQLQKSSNKGGFYNNNNNNGELLFPTIICHTDESDKHGVDRYNLIDSVLSKMCDEHENENDFQYFMKKVPIYNRNINIKNKNKNKHTLHGACFFASIGVNLARSVEEEGILITPVAPLLKMRKNISGPSEDYNEEESIDKDTISLSVMLAPGIFSSHDEVVEFASNIQQIQDMDQNNSFLSDCDKKPYQRSSVNIGFSETSYYFFYEFNRPDLVAGITHKCHRLFLEHIVTKPQVISVEKVAKNKISNHHARWTVESGTKDYRPFSDFKGLNGKGETVFVADTGLDEQHCYLKDYDGNTVESTTGWDLTGKIDRNLRKVIQYIELDDIASDRKDSNGHGTHIVASIVGKRLKNGVEVDGLGDGVANGALISFYDGNNALASDGDGEKLSISVNSIISQFFYFPQMAEAKIASASWNSGVFGEYDDRTRQVDEYFHNDPNDLMLMFNSAGNEGRNTMSTNYGTTKYPCISKNVLCVGASLNYHSDMSEISAVASFSSYGPTKDGRIKPDIVSPGEYILSANAGFNGCGPDSYPESVKSGVNHDGLVFKRGTSMACPIAAGAGALVRQYFADGYYPTGKKENEKMQITGSLLKAVLINGAVELKRRSKPGGEYDDSEYYDRYQGFGKINLLNSLKLADELSSPDLYVENEMVNEDSPDLHVENERIVKKGQTHEYVFENVCNDHEFRATLVWRDPPSDSGCVECLVNDLDLEVDYDGKTYYPNGRDGPDEKNNVERVILEISKFTTPTNNTIHVKVKTANLGVDVEQKYSLASTGCFDSNEVEMIGSESDSMCEEDEFEYTVDIFTNRKPEETSWILKKQGSDEVIDVVTAGEYEEGVDRLKSFRYNGCLVNGCYFFIIKDTAVDGLCCDKGMGSYSIRAGSNVRMKDDSFVDRQKIEKFCNYGLLGGEEPTASPTVVCNDNEFKYQIDIETDLHPDETRWLLLRKPHMDGVDQGNYTESYREYVHEGCLDIGGCYSFFVYGIGEYTIKANEFVVAERESFKDGNYEEICYSEESNDSTLGFAHASLPQTMADSPTTQPTSLSCGDNQFRYQIIIRPDDRPEEVWWELHSIVDSVPFMTYRKQLESYSHTDCAAMDENYKFLMIDKRRDGLCCYFGSGSYKLSVDNNVVVRGNHFDDATHVGEWDNPDFFVYNRYEFSYTSTLQPTSKPIQMSCGNDKFEYRIRVRTNYFPETTRWTFKYSDGVFIKNVDRGDYLLQHYEYNHNGCLPLNECVEFYIEASYGLCCTWGNGGYTIFVNDVVMAEGGEFDSSETKTFCYGQSYSQSPSSYPSTLNPTSSNHPSSRPITVGPTFTNPVCESGSNNNLYCAYWVSIGLCDDDSNYQNWMQEKCSKACSNCCLDYLEECDDYYDDGRCTDTSTKSHGLTWQGFMQASCRMSCDTCDLDFTPSTTLPQVTCSDDQFEYEIIATNDDYSYYFSWYLRYKYPDLIDGYVDVDHFSGEFPPNYEKKYYGCASYSCFDLWVSRAYLKIYNKDKDILIAQNTEKNERLRFCHYTQQPTALPTISSSPSYPFAEAIITISLEFSTFQSNSEDISKVLQRSVMKIFFHTEIENGNIVMDILDSFCETEFKRCEIIIQVCTDICGEVEEPDFLAFVGNTMKESEANGQLLQTIKATTDQMDVGIVDSLTQVSIFYSFEFDAWPTTSPTTSPSSTPTQDCNSSAFVQNLFYFIMNIFEPITKAITNTADPNSDVLFGVEPHNSIGITTCKDKMFELQLEIKTDGSPDRTSWELLYENGTIIESIGRETYSESDMVYNHSYCLDTSCFVFNMFDSFEFKGSYNITVGDNVLAQQDSFLWWRESKRFCYPQCDDDNMFALQLELITDDWPQETSWQLAFDNGTIVDQVEESYYTGRNSFYNHRYCLFDGCYDVTFYDHIGDGMCCSYGSGSFKMKINDNNVIREGGKFGDSIRKSFCHMTGEISEENNSFLFGIITDLLGDGSCCTMDTTGYPTPYPTTTLSIPSTNPSSNPPITQPTTRPTKLSSLCDGNEFKYAVIVTTDRWPGETSWELIDAEDRTLIDGVEEGEYTQGNTEHVHKDCLDLDRCVIFRIFDSYKDGICCSEGIGRYTILVNDFVMAEGGEFGDKETTEFCFGPSYSLQPSSSPLVVQVDFSQGDDCPTCTPYTLHNGAEIKTAPGGFQALRIDSDGPYAKIPGVDIGPSNMPDCTLTIGLYLESKLSLGHVFGHEESGWDRGIVLHDSRDPILARNLIFSAVGTHWMPWVDYDSETGTAPTKEWFHVTAVFRQGGECAVYVNGVKSDYTTIGENNEGLPDLYVGRPLPWDDHWTDAWIREVKVFDEALTDAQVQYESDSFLTNTMSPTHSLQPSSSPSHSLQPSYSLQPSFGPLVVQVDFSQGDDCPTCNPYSLHNGAEIKTAPGGFQALRIDSDGPYAKIPGVDIGPSNMPECTLTIGLYLESKQSLGYVFGHEELNFDRGIILHDSRGFPGQNMITSATGQVPWMPWAGNNLETGTAPTKEWFHVTAVFRQGGECTVYVNGVKSDYTTTGQNSEGYPDLYVGRPLFWDDHWTDAWIREVKVFDKALTDAQVQDESNSFLATMSPTQSLQPSSSPVPSSNPSSSPPTTHPTIRPTTLCNENQFRYEVFVTTDRWPAETSWELIDENGTLFDSIEPGEYTVKYTEHVHKDCLDLDSCVIFTIFDSNGDGICCDSTWGNGNYMVLANDIVMAEGGEFGEKETTEFCFGPSYSLQPTSSPLVVQVDFSQGDDCPTCTPYTLHNGAEIKTAPGGTQALRIDSDGPYAKIPGVDIGPSNMPDCTLTIGLYLESKTLGVLGWIFGHDNGGADRTIVLHDSRDPTLARNLIFSAVGKGWMPWADYDSVTGRAPTKEWFHVTAVFRQGGECAVYVNGVKSDYTTTGQNSEGLPDLYVGRPLPWNGHWADAWIKEVKVFDEALTDAQVQYESDSFLANTMSPTQSSQPSYSLQPSSSPSHSLQPSYSLQPSSSPLVVQVDFSQGDDCPTCTPYSLHNGAEIKTAPGGFQALRIESDGPYAKIPGVDIGPFNMPECTLTIGLYLESKQSFGYVFGHEELNFDRGIILHDSRGFPGQNMITSATGQVPWMPWAGNNLETGTAPTKEWFHVTAVFRQGGECAVYVNGVKSDYTTTGQNSEGLPDLYVGRPLPWNDHWTDAWIREVKVFDKALTDAQVQYESDSFLANTMSLFAQVDFSQGDDCPTCTPYSLHNGAEIKTAPGGTQALRIDSDGPYAKIPGVDIGPSNMPDCTLTIGLYLESKTLGVLGWIFGHDNGGADRTIVLHDSRDPTLARNLIFSAVGKGWMPWADYDSETGTAPTKEWFHVTAVFRQGGECAVYVNGVKSDYTTIGENNEGLPDLYVGRPLPWNGHWADAWIREVKVFDEALTDAQVQYESDSFLAYTMSPTYSLQPSSQPSYSLQPSFGPLVVQVDFSQGDDCPTCNPYSLHNGAEIKTAPGGFQALRIESDGPYAKIPGVDIGPSNMPECTLTIGLYLESKQSFGYVFGHEEEGFDRGIILHDSRGFPGQNMITSATGQVPWMPWAGNNLETGTAPTKEWFHVTAVFRQGGECAVYVNGVKSDYTTTGQNSEGLPDLYVGRPLFLYNHWADAWIKEVKVFDEALTDAQVQDESDSFLANTMSLFAQVDFSQGDDCPTCTPYSLHNGAEIKTAPGGFQALRIDSDGPYAKIPGVDIGPSNMPDCTLTIGLYLESKQSFGYVFGHEELAWDRTIILHDPRNIAGQNVIHSAVGIQSWMPWAGNNLETGTAPTKEWFHVTAVFRQGGECAVYVNGVKSDYTTTGQNSEGLPDLYVGRPLPWNGHWTDAWIKEVKVFDEALTDAQVQYESDSFLATMD